jgi:RHS repeat-associated protein
MAEAWQRPETGSDTRLTVERWHFEPTNFRPLAKEVIHADDRDGAFAVAGTDFYPIVTDHLGTPKEMFDGEGQCLWRATHELWGRARTARAIVTARVGASEQDDDGPDCALRFPNQWADEESGLHYNLNRYYDPETGQYLSPDPIGLRGGARTHAYVHDPMQWFDPLGLAGCGDATGPVEPGQTGTYGELKTQKRLYGETEPMDMDHQPSYAAQVAAKESALGRPLTPTERATLKASTPAVASPRAIHQQTSPTYGGRNTPTLIANDAADLPAAQARDQAVFNNAMGKR